MTYSPAPQLVTPPALLPVTLAEAKAHLRVDHDDENPVIEALLESAVALLDGWGGVLGRGIMPQTWAQEFGGWGDLPLSLPDVTGTPLVEGFDAAGAAVAATKADLFRRGGGAVMVTEGGPNVVRVRVTYDVALPAVRMPAAKALVKLMVGHGYADRGDGAAPMAMPPAAQALVNALRWVRL